MSVVPPSDAVIDIIRSASDGVLIAAPYIKSQTLRRLLAALPDAADELTCVTRWLPEDIVSGVCDIEIFEDITAHSAGNLLVHPHLHAKYYRAGDRCLVGSANLTKRGLGWMTPANLELLVELPLDFPGLHQWEAALLASAVPATEELRDQIVREAERLKADATTRHVPEVEQDTEEEIAASQWIPGCPVPERLWNVYKGGGTGQPANLELLVELPLDFPGLHQWEAALLASAVPATEELRDQIVREAERLKADATTRHVPEVEQDTEEEIAASQWIPGCPVPERLWNVYKGGGTGTMVSSAREAAQHDLTALAPPHGLSQQLFEAYIAGILKQMPLMAEIDRFASTGLTDSQAHTFIGERLGADALNPTDQSWRVLKAWLVHFFPETYRLETGQEVLVKGKELPR